MLFGQDSLSYLVSDVPDNLKSRIQEVVVERRAVLKLIGHADPGMIVESAEITKIESANVQPRDQIAVELVVPGVNLIFSSQLKPGKDRTTCCVSPWTECWCELRREGQQCRRHVTAREFGTNAHALPGPLQIRSIYIFVTAPHDPGRQQLMPYLD